MTTATVDEIKNVTPKKQNLLIRMFKGIWAATKWLWGISKNLTIAIALCAIIFFSYQIFKMVHIPGATSGNWVSKNCIVTERPQFWFFGDTQFHFQSDGIKGYLDVDDKFFKIGAVNKVGDDTEEISMEAYNVRLNPDHSLGLINFENGLLKGSINKLTNTMELKFNGSIIGEGAFISE